MRQAALDAYPRGRASAFRDDGVEQDASRPSCEPGATHGNSKMKLWMYASKGISVRLDGATCRHTAWPSHVAFRLASESVEFEVKRTPQSGLRALTGGRGTDANAGSANTL